MPVLRRHRGKRPAQRIPRQTLRNLLIISDIMLIVEINKRVCRRPEINRKGRQSQDDA